VASAFLFCKDGKLKRSHIRQKRVDGISADGLRIYNSLAGETDVNCQIIFDKDGKKSFFFIFPQVSVRIKGEFRLKFLIFNPRLYFFIYSFYRAERSSLGCSPIMAEIFSDPFIVYTIKTFPGVEQTTELSNLIKNQGIKFNSRRSGQKDSSFR
jgi:hypothetical protein